MSLGSTAGQRTTNAPEQVEPESSPWDEVQERLREATSGEFVIIRELGRGGMAAVYLAHDMALNRKVAIKVMSPGLLMGPGMVERFRQEAVTVANLNHPYITTIHAVRQAAGLHYFVMKLIAGRSLESVIRSHGQLPIPIVQAILFQVGTGLAYAHRRGVIHRDVKPGNILMDEDCNAVLTDFGIAKVLESPSNTMTGATVGTPAYMSPEQCWAREVTAASDQYSLGIVAYEMLVGAPPFTGQTLGILRSHTEDQPPPVRQARDDVPEAMAAAVERMLAKEPGDRFLDIRDAVTALGGKPLPEHDPLRDLLAGLFDLEPSQWSTESARGPVVPRAPVVPRVSLPSVAAPPARHGSELLATGGPRSESRDNPLFRLVTWLSRLVTWCFRGAWLRGRRGPGAAPRAPSPPPVEERTGQWDRSAADIDITAGWRVPSPAPAPSEPSTRPFNPADWAPSGDPDTKAPEPPGGSTQVFIAPGSDSAGQLFPVALSVSSAPDPSQVGMKVTCDHFPFTVGRAESSDLCIHHDSALSRTHFEVDLDENGFLIRELSTNGVFVNGRRLWNQTEPLFFGARIVLSKVTAITFVADIPMLPDLSGQLVDGRYQLRSLVHQSVKAATYVSDDLRVSRSVAIKLFSPTLTKLAHYRSEFQRQAKLAAKLQHPHICKVIDYGETALRVGGISQTVSYLCTEFMEGGNLGASLESSSRPGPAAVSSWIQALAGALEYAHRHGVIHGDIKPACIVFDSEGTPYLTDFALAWGGESATRSVVGTPDYLAPEQWEGEQPSGATDQYSLAVLAYLMLTGTRPHEGQSDPAVRSRNFRRGPPLAHEEARLAGRDGVTRAVSLVLGKAMSVIPADRYASLREFSAALDDAVKSPHRSSTEPRIFMSYQRESSAGWANLFARTLKEQHGWSVFIDTQARDGAPQIPDRLRDEIAACDVFVCMLAPQTLTSRWVRQEIEIACRCNKPMVPIFHEDFRPKDENEASDASVSALLNFAAVHLLDRRNIHVDHTIAELADRVRKLVT